MHILLLVEDSAEGTKFNKGKNYWGMEVRWYEPLLGLERSIRLFTKHSNIDAVYIVIMC